MSYSEDERYFISDAGYAVYDGLVSRDGEWIGARVKMHQLAAIASGADPYRVFSNGEYEVHHETFHRFDNRPVAVSCLPEEIHQSLHCREIVEEQIRRVNERPLNPPSAVELLG